MDTKNLNREYQIKIAVERELEKMCPDLYDPRQWGNSILDPTSVFKVSNKTMELIIDRSAEDTLILYSELFANKMKHKVKQISFKKGDSIEYIVDRIIKELIQICE